MAGFTLVETIVAVATSSILLLTLGSVITLAARAVPTGTEPIVRAAEVERGVARLLADFEEAIDYDKTDGSHVLHLGVPDRNGDGIGEVVQYWTDGSGRLVRVLNGGTAEAIFGGVKQITISHTNTRDTTNSFDVVDRAQVRIEFTNQLEADRYLRVRLLNSPRQR